MILLLSYYMYTNTYVWKSIYVVQIHECICFIDDVSCNKDFIHHTTVLWLLCYDLYLQGVLIPLIYGHGNEKCRNGSSVPQVNHHSVYSK